MNIKIQTMELDLTTPSLIYTKPSKIWDINENKLTQFDFFKTLFNFNKKNIYLLNEISDKEMELLLNYINYGTEEREFNIMKLETNDIMLLIKLSDFLIIPELFKIVSKEFFNRL